MRKANAALELHLASLSRQLVALRAAKMQPTTAARPGLRADLRSAETCADVDAATRGVRCASLSAADARCIRALREQIRDLDCLGGTVSGCSGGGGGDGGGDGRDVLPRGALLPASDVGGGASELSIAASGLVAALAEAARRHAMDVSAIGVAHQARVAEVVQRSRGARIADREAAAAAAELHAEELRRIESDGAQRAAELERQRGVASAREAECKRRIAAARARVAPLLAIVDQRNDAIGALGLRPRVRKSPTPTRCPPPPPRARVPAPTSPT
jgi:hypothetical protein